MFPATTGLLYGILIVAQSRVLLNMRASKEALMYTITTSEQPIQHRLQASQHHQEPALFSNESLLSVVHRSAFSVFSDL